MFGLRYRLLLILIGSSLVVLLAYFSIARILFESDKSSVIYDTLFEATNSRAEKIDHHIEHHIALAKAMMISRSSLKNSQAFTYMLRLAPEIKKAWFFKNNLNDEKNILSFAGEQVSDQELLAMDKEFASLFKGVFTERGLSKIAIPDRFLVWQKVDEGAEASAYLVIALQWPDLRAWLETQVGLNFLLTNSQLEALWLSGGVSEREIEISKVLQKDSSRNWATNPEQTFELDFNDKRSIISTVKIPSINARLVAMADHASFFRPLEELRVNSILFVIFVISIFAVISVFLAQTISRKLELLTASAEKVAGGNLDVEVDIRSRDEVGRLAQTFNLMVARIKNLLTQTAHKARMESELRTAQAVQRTLFPKDYFRLNRLQLAGSYQSASECGGDWWYYFCSGDIVYVLQCDATGHGAPAALMTSGARAIISVLEQNEKFDLVDIALKLSNGIYDLSKGELMMTAFVLRLDSQTGDCQFINASHENPMILRKEHSEPEFVIHPNNPRLGENQNQKFTVGKFSLKSGDRLFIYTDGLFAVESLDGKSIGERRGLKKVTTLIHQAANLTEGINSIKHWLSDYGGDKPLPDDITMISLQMDT